jgi:peptide/nickel transport system permease protein
VSTYVVRRLIQAGITLVLLSIVFFLLVRFRPGGPCSGPDLFKHAAFGCAENLHLDEPISNQYLYWLGSLLHGDFGSSVTGVSVRALIMQKLPPTLLLVVVSLTIQQLIALPLGMLAALRQYSFFDQLLTVGSYFFLSLPAFLLGMFLISLFAVSLGLLPVGHPDDVALPLLGSVAWFGLLWQNPALALGDMIQHLLLPGFVLASTGIAIDSRFMRASLLQVLHQDYIRTARAKGLRRRRIIFKHALRNALLPIVTNIGLYLPALLGGVVVVETVFTWGGLGYTFSSAILDGPDFPTLQALVLLSALTVVVANLLADLTYAWLDPRIRLEAAEEV